jgi:hypothetical protein
VPRPLPAFWRANGITTDTGYFGPRTKALIARLVCLGAADKEEPPASGGSLSVGNQDGGAKVFALNGFDGMPSIMSFR